MHLYSFDTGDISITSAHGVTTVLQLVTGATRRAKIVEFGVSFSSVTATDVPVVADFVLQTTAGTGGTAATIRALDAADPAAISTGLTNIATTEPTGTTAQGPGGWRITPVGGLFVYQFPQGQEILMAVSTRVGLRLNAAQNESNLRAYLVFQE